MEEIEKKLEEKVKEMLEEGICEERENEIRYCSYERKDYCPKLCKYSRRENGE